MTDSEGNEIGKLFVGGLSQATTNGSLRLYFSKFGEVDDAVVMMDNKTGRSRGFGYVKYREPDSVSLALDAKPHILDGKEVDAKQCNVNMKGRNRRSLKIFVGGIGLDQDAESIKNFFRQFGRVTDVNLMMDSNKQRHRGFAFVGFEDESIVKRLIGLHYVMMNSKQVEIKAMEPPNFGRKIGPNACLTTAAIMAGTSPGEEACGHAFENGPDAGGILAGGMTAGAAFVNHIPYLQAQSTGISCMPADMVATTRSHMQNLYDHAAFNTSLENLYHPAAYFQPIGHINRIAENIQTSVPPGPYVAPKQPVPLLVANAQYHTGTHTPLTAVNQSSPSLYATIPYQLISPTFIPSPQQPTVAGLNPMIATGKPTSGWPTGAFQTTQLALCPTQLTPASNLVSCPPCSPQYPTTQLASTATLQNPAQTDITGGAPLFTPYYAICPQYTAIPLQTDQPVGSPYTLHSTTAMIGANAASNNLQGSPNGSGNTPGIPGSKPSTPTNEGVNVQTSNKTPYPTILMTPPNNLQNSTIINSNNPAMNIGQSLWNQPQSSLVYSSVPLGWTVQNSTQTAAPQTWPSSCSISQQLQTTSYSNSDSAKVTNMSTSSSDHVESKVQEDPNVLKRVTADSTNLAQTKASGDTMDNVASASEQTTLQYSNGLFNSSPAYRYQKQPNEQKSLNSGNLSDSVKWQVNEDVDTSGNVLTPSWTSTPISDTPVRWKELNQSKSNFGPTSSLSAIHHPWQIQMDLTENPTAIGEVASNQNRRSPITQRLPNSNSSAKRGLTDQRPVTQMASNVASEKPTTEANKASPICTQVSTRSSSRYQIPNSIGQHNTTESQQLTGRINTNSQAAVDDDVQKKKSATRSLVGTNGTEARIDYTSWMYHKPAGATHAEGSTGDKKDLQSNSNVGLELECQGPAGAAGDYHRPVHTANYSSYRSAR